MLQPKKTKYRKSHRMRGSQYGTAGSGARLAFGSFGLKAVSGGEITSRQIEAARKSVTRYLKRGGKLWIRIFPHMPISRKAAEVPMGSGKGNVEFYVSPIKAGRMLFELDGIPANDAKSALRLAGSKLPVRTKFVTTELV